MVPLLIGLVIKSALVAAMALAGAALLGARPAAEKVAVLRLGVIMILALPLLAAVIPALRIETLPLPGPSAPVAGAALPAGALAATAPHPGVPAGALRPLDPALALLALWGAGAGLLLLRLGAGVATLHSLTRAAEPVRHPCWLTALDRAAPTGPRPVLRASSRVSSPLSWGVRPPVILLNTRGLAHADRADAVLTHEMGHVRHRDWLFLMLTRLLVAILWFNPLVWLLQRELARQSEHAADAWALRRIEPADYASALVAFAASGRPHAAVGMAGSRGELTRRINAIMSPSRQGRPWPTAVAIAGCIGLATPLAALELTPRSPTPRVETPRPGPITPQATASPPSDPAAPGADGRTVSKASQPAPAPVASIARAPWIDGGQTGIAVPVAVQLPLQVSMALPSPAEADHQAVLAAARHEAADHLRAQGLREGARQLRQGAAELDAGAVEVERGVFGAPDAGARRDVVDEAEGLRREADRLRSQADAMEAEAGPIAPP